LTEHYERRFGINTAMRFLHTQLKNRFLHFKIYFSFSEKYNIEKEKITSSKKNYIHIHTHTHSLLDMSLNWQDRQHREVIFIPISAISDLCHYEQEGVVPPLARTLLPYEVLFLVNNVFR
jgi:hypothetical protein